MKASENQECKQTRRQAIEQGAKRSNRAARTDMMKPDIRWYAVLVRSGKEFIAQKMLRRYGCAVYVPMSRKWRRLNRYKQEKTKIAYAALPGMVFVGYAEGEERWFDIFSNITCAYGVLGVAGKLIAFNGPTLADFVTRNRSTLDVADEEKWMRTHREFKIGDRVQIVAGPLDGHIVDVRDIKGNAAIVLMEFFGGIKQIEISLEKLEKAA